MMWREEGEKSAEDLQDGRRRNCGRSRRDESQPTWYLQYDMYIHNSFPHIVYVILDLAQAPPYYCTEATYNSNPYSSSMHALV